MKSHFGDCDYEDTIAAKGITVVHALLSLSFALEKLTNNHKIKFYKEKKRKFEFC